MSTTWHLVVDTVDGLSFTSNALHAGDREQAKGILSAVVEDMDAGSEFISFDCGLRTLVIPRVQIAVMSVAPSDEQPPSDGRATS